MFQLKLQRIHIIASLLAHFIVVKFSSNDPPVLFGDFHKTNTHPPGCDFIVGTVDI